LTRKVGFGKLTCRKCGFVNFIPLIDGRIAVETIAKCEQCGSVIVKREKNGRLNAIPRKLRSILHR
jgi:predicted RNA-binding Zn-ribbon protein involved in translation (DUF1610 family)